MNQQRRKAIEELVKRVTALQDELSLVAQVSRLEDAKTDAQDIQGEEQEYLDNMPESFQGGEKGEAAQAVVDYLEEAGDALQEIFDAIETITDKAQEALDALSNAMGA